MDELEAYLAKSQIALRQLGESEITPQARKMGETLEAWALANPNQRVMARPVQKGQWSVRSLYAVGLVLLTLAVPRVWQRIASHSSSNEVITREYVTHRGQQAKVQLPDGSQVVMAPDTRISYTTSSRGGRGGYGDRTVSLQGQAYFTVTHDVNRPFTVQTGTISTRVLGTAFAVRAYPTDRVAQVAVAEGKVSIGTQQAASVILLPGDVARVAPDQAPIVTHDSKTADVFGWMHGQLAFDGVPFSEVAVELERLYDIEIKFSDSALANRRIVAVFAGESVSKVLGSLSAAVDVSYTRTGKIVVFTAK